MDSCGLRIFPSGAQGSPLKSLVEDCTSNLPFHVGACDDIAKLAGDWVPLDDNHPPVILQADGQEVSFPVYGKLARNPTPGGDLL